MTKGGGRGRVSARGFERQREKCYLKEDLKDRLKLRPAEGSQGPLCFLSRLVFKVKTTFPT